MVADTAAPEEMETICMEEAVADTALLERVDRIPELIMGVLPQEDAEDTCPPHPVLIVFPVLEETVSVSSPTSKSKGG